MNFKKCAPGIETVSPFGRFDGHKQRQASRSNCCDVLSEERRYDESESSSVSDSLWPRGLCSPWNSLGQNTGVSSLSLLQGVFPTQVSCPAGDSLPAEP